jgi:GNAT superfamily N-acetyltransferase
LGSRNPSAQVALRQAYRTLVVVPAEVRAVTAAARVTALVGPLTSTLQVVVRGPAPGGLDAQVVAEAVGLRLAVHPNHRRQGIEPVGESDGRRTHRPGVHLGPNRIVVGSSNIKQVA